MTDTATNPEAHPSELGLLLEQWVESPPPSLTAALAEREISPEALEDYTRSGISTDAAESLRRVLVEGAKSGQPEDAALLARLTPLLDPRERAWERVLRAKASGETLTAPVTEATKGGVVVDLGVRGFVPASHIGLSVPRNLQQYVGRTLKLRVLEIDRRRQTVILSNKVVAEEERAEKRRNAITRIQEGETRNGTVRRMIDIGAFVDVGGIDGFLHVSEISWQRVEKPADVLQVGQKVDVKVLRVDPEHGKVSLSMRRLTPDPWEEVRRTYQPGTTTTVKIIKTVAQGAIVELVGGLEGFIPISELAPRRIATPEEAVQVGQEVEALVLDVQPRDRRVTFSIRKLEQKKDRAVVDTYQKSARRQASSERTTLGDLFGHLFAELKQDEPQSGEADGSAEARLEDAPARPDEIPAHLNHAHAEPSDDVIPGAETAEHPLHDPNEAAVENLASVDEDIDLKPAVELPGTGASAAATTTEDATGSVDPAVAGEETGHHEAEGAAAPPTVVAGSPAASEPAAEVADAAAGEERDRPAPEQNEHA